MTSSRTGRRARIAALVAAALAVGGAPLLASPAQAASSGLVIAEFYGNGGNTGAVRNADFIELWNPTASPIGLAGLSVQYRSATGSGVANGVAPLSGTVGAGKRFLVRLTTPTANGAALPTPDLIASGVSAGGTNGLIFLANTTTAINPGIGSVVSNPAVIDLLGFGTANTYETAAATGVSDNTKSFTRTNLAADGDNNLTDFSATTPTPQNAAGDTDAAAPLTVETIGGKTGIAGYPIAPFSVSATGGTAPYTFGDGGTLPPGLAVNATTGAVTGTPTTAGSYQVTITATDSATPTAATDTETFTFTVLAAPTAVTPIKDVQGTGAASPLDGQAVKTQGVVTASYPTGGLDGFYVQTPGADTPNASDAVFVFGNGGFSTYPAVGDSVQLTGLVSEFNGLTEITVSSNEQVTKVASLGTVTPKTVVPGTDCTLPGDGCPTGTALDAAREAVEGEAFQPTTPWTLTDVYDGGPAYTNGSNSSSNFGELGVAAGSTKPLVAPTEVIDAQNTAEVAKRVAYNNAHRIVMDDGSGTNYTTTTSSAFPWMTPTSVPRVGAAVTFPAPVIFTWGFSQWRIEPSSQVVGAPTATQPQITNTRGSVAAPEAVGGDLKLATFNVLNFFPTTGADFVGAGLGTCTYYNDRANQPVTVNTCTNNGPRGAANAENLARQRAKIVAAINTAGADIVSLEELENSAQFGKPRDYAIGQLVDALNADAGAGTWSFVPSPAASDLPPLAQQDVIRTGFIYRTSTVAPVGASVVLADQSGTGGDFEDAREPLAQAFKAVGTSDSKAFAVIVNHFKSKGSGNPDAYGQGNANDRRVLQAKRLATFADSFKAARGLDKVFLVGDFNAYSEEDPIQELEKAGYTNLDSTTDPEEESYNFDGMVGSLDHVLANSAALGTVTGVDVWTINSYESVYYEYSRYNYNATNLYAANPFRSSDHNPELVGIAVKDASSVSAPATSVEYGAAVTIPVTVTGGATPATGTVQLFDGSTLVASGSVTGGSATVTVPARAVLPGTRTLRLVYSGDGDHRASEGAVTLTVRQASSTVSASVATAKPKVGKKVKLAVSVTAANGVPVTGQVTAIIKGGTAITVDLVNGSAVINLGTFTKPGKKSVEVQYLGSSTVDQSTTTVTFKVKKKNKRR
jgi:5'-nucleotidase